MPRSLTCSSGICRWINSYLAESDLPVSYVGNRGLDLFSTQEGNPCTPTSITNGVPYWADGLRFRSAKSKFGSIALITTSADSYYHGLQVGLTKRLSNGLEFQSPTRLEGY